MCHLLSAQGHCPATPLPVCSSETLGPVPRSLRSGLRTLRALCRWPPRTQKMPDGAPANPKGCKKKGLVRHPPGRRGPSIRTSSRTSRYVPASLGWSPRWRRAGRWAESWLLEPISSESLSLLMTAEILHFLHYQGPWDPSVLVGT